MLSLLDTNMGSVRVFVTPGAGGGGAGPAPANPGDDGAVAIASGGVLTYLKGTTPNQYLSWNGTTWTFATPITPPANPGDNGKLAVASNGDFVYTDTPTLTRLTIGTPAALAGQFRVQHGFLFNGWGPVSGADYTILDWGTAASETLFIGGVLPPAMAINSKNNLTFYLNSVQVAQLQGTGYVFGQTVTGMVFQNSTTLQSAPGVGGAGQTMTIAGQDQTAANGNGGHVNVRGGGGNGTGIGGFGYLNVGTATPALANSRFTWNDTGIGFFTQTPVAKQALAGSKGGNVALASVCTALAAIGLFTDGTT
jgi:hypothetical protein